LNCELIGLSIDSVFSHIAWIRNVEEKFGEKIMFPIIADLNKNVAGLYGMIMPGEEATSTSRCLFVIDDRQVIRAMIYYPFTTGRNIDEVLRLLNALQLSDEYGVGTRANWKPGDKVILFPPLSKDDSDQRVAEYKDSCVDWYFCETDL
jgi:peroxiredoxin (alkyl hydroperoxide reductase subunit C)